MANIEITWPDADRLSEFLHNNPMQAVSALATVLSQEQANALFSAVFPPASDAEKTAVVEEVRKRLLRAGYSDDSTPMKWASEEIAALTTQ